MEVLELHVASSILEATQFTILSESVTLLCLNIFEYSFSYFSSEVMPMYKTHRNKHFLCLP